MEIEIGGRTLSLEFDLWAKQADSSVVGRYGDTLVLATVTRSKNTEPEGDFIPLTVEYREKNYAAGKIPGGFIKREGKPSDWEILCSRTVDRSIRPLISKYYRNEIQILAWVMSHDQENQPDVLTINTAYLAILLSPVPFYVPAASVRVGWIDNSFVINPTLKQMEKSRLDLIVSGTEEGIVMVEAGAKFVPEEVVVEAIQFGHEQIKKIVREMKKIYEVVKPEKDPDSPPCVPEEIKRKVEEMAEEKIISAFEIKEKKKRRQTLSFLLSEVYESLSEEEKQILPPYYFNFLITELERKILRKKLFTTSLRIDGRKSDELREIICKVGILPRTHGSALFQRGETLAMVVTTLGSPEDKQIVEALEGESAKHFMLHYNFPPFCVGEVKPVRGPGRREIGHGALAERALSPVIPSEEEFPYTIRVVSDILESNGSSSMATVCGASLSLMDAGVPLKKHIAGVAMGLVIEGEKYEILTDILGDEDHMGDMDFKIAGSEDGITALQMDVKIQKVDYAILREALNRSRTARLKILEIMKQVISAPREEVSKYAPRVKIIKIKPERIKDLIGPGGKNIKSIIEQTNSVIDINQDGTVKVFAPEEKLLNRAIELINSLTEEPEVGKIYTGKVVKVFDYGVLVEIMPGAVGLLHKSQIDFRQPKKIEDLIKVGDSVEVMLTKIENDGKMFLSRKEAIKEARKKGLDVNDGIKQRINPRESSSQENTADEKSQV